MKQVIVECDSLEVVNLVNINCPDLHYAIDTVKRIHELMKKDWRVELKHILREQNELADAVAHLAQNLVYDCHILQKIPIEALSIQQKDDVGVEHPTKYIISSFLFLGWAHLCTQKKKGLLLPFEVWNDQQA